mgnify:CR=1 FL=1
MSDQRVRIRGERLHMPRSRGALSGFLLILLGAWGALAPFVGPDLNFAMTPDEPWLWTDARGWLQVLPGVVAAIGGLLLLVSRNRATAMLGGWLAVAGGAWFVVGRVLAGPLGLGDAGAPVAATDTKAAAVELAFFSGLGALIVLLAALALGRISVRSVRDVEYFDAPVASRVEPPPSDEVTQIQPTAYSAQPMHVPPQPPAARPRRGLRDMFGRRRTTAH